MEEWTEFIKSIVRPFIIIWGLVVYSVCIIVKVEVPYLLSGLISIVILEYFGERAIKRFKENGKEK